MASKPTVFISYRRGSSRDLARLIQTRLKTLGADVFLDVEDINSGKFSARLEREIIARDYFVVILKPDTLDSQFVRKEIEIALRHDKHIVPVEADGFVWPATLPTEIAGLADHDGIAYSHDYADAAMRRVEIALELGKAQMSTLARILRDPIWQGVGVIVAVIAIFLTLRDSNNSNNNGVGINPTYTPTTMDIRSTITETPTPRPIITPTLTLTVTQTSTETPTPTHTETPVISLTSTLAPVSVNAPAEAIQGQDVPITAWRGATCDFTYGAATSIRIQTSTGNITYTNTSLHPPGTVVNVYCYDEQGRSATSQFMIVGQVALPTNTATFTPTNTSIPPSATSVIERSASTCRATTRSLSGATSVPIHSNPSINAPRLAFLPVNESIILTARDVTGQIVWYRIEDTQQVRWIQEQYLNFVSNCTF